MRTNSFTKLKRALALVLTFCMVMSGMSLTSFAADDAKPAGSGWQIMDSGNFGVGSKAVDTTKTDAPVTTYSKTSEEDSKVIVSKEISATDTENVFDITLTVKTSEEIIGEVVSPNTATVLVIDTSNSMTTNKDKTDATKTRLVAAQAAANAFLQQLHDDAQTDGGHRWVKIIGYNYDITVMGGDTWRTWRDVATDEGLGSAKNDVDTLKTNSGTNLHEALLKGDELLDAIENNSGESTMFGKIDNYFLVAMTDGQANAYKNMRDRYTSDNRMLKTVYEETLKAGRAIRRDENGNEKNNRYVYGIIYDAATTKIYSETVNNKTVNYTVEDLFKGFTNQYFAAGANVSIATSFGNVASAMSILTKAWHVTDPMGDRISFVEKLAKNGAVAGESVAKCSANTLDWNLLADTCDSIPTENDKFYTYTLKYRVELDTESEGFIEEENGSYHYYPTNGYTYLQYVFMDEEGFFYDEDHNKLADQANPTFYEIAFTVPGVGGEVPEYDFTVEFYKQNDNGTYDLVKADTLSYGDLDRWTAIDISYANVCNGKGEIVTPYASKYENYELVSNATRLLDAKGSSVNEWVLTENGMKLCLYYNPIKTDLTVNYYVRTDVIDSTTGELTKGEYSKDAASRTFENMNAGSSYTAPELTTAGLTKVTENGDVNGKEAFTAQSITLDAEAEKNVINLYYKTLVDQRSEAKASFYHVYKNYEWQLGNDGKYHEVLVLDTTETPVLRSSSTAKVPKNSFTYDYPAADKPNENSEFDYAFKTVEYADNTKTVASVSGNRITVTPAAAGDYSATVFYEHHGKKPEEISVLVYHEYVTQTETIVKNENGEYEMEIVTTGTGEYEHSENSDVYTALAGETVKVSEAPKDGFTSAEGNAAKLTHEGSKDGDKIYLQYSKYVPLETVTVNTVSHFRTWTPTVNTTTGAISWTCVEDAKDEAAYPTGDVKLYLGQSFTVNPNPEDRSGYVMDGMKEESNVVSDAVRIEQLAKTNTLEFFYDKYEDIEIASVQVVHKYYKYVQTIDGIDQTLIPVCEDNEVAEDILYNFIGETETFTPVTSFGGYDDYELDPATQTTTARYTSLGADGAAGTVITLIYSRVSDERVATDLSVQHNYYSKTMTVTDGVAAYPANWTLDAYFCNPFEADVYKQLKLYKGMTVEVSAENENNGITYEGYKAGDENNYLKTLGDKGENLVVLNYYKEIPLDPAAVTVTHTYKTYTCTYDEVSGRETVELTSTVEGTSVVSNGKYVGERYEAKEELLEGFELESCEFNDNAVTEKVADGKYVIDAIADNDQVDYVYVRFEGKREAAEVKVFHFYTTIDDYDGSVFAGYDASTKLDVTTGEAYVPEGPGEYQSYVGLNFTATPDCKPLNGIDSYEITGSDPAMTIEVAEEGNVINVYYVRHFSSRAKVEAVENHSYFIYDRYTGVTTEVEDLNWSKTASDLWEGEEFSAAPDTKNGEYKMETAEEALTIVLLSDSSLNVVNVKYVKTIDTTPERKPEPETPAEPENLQTPEEPEEPETIEEPDVPLADVPEFIDDQEVPLAAAPEEFEDLPEDEVPLAAVPETSDHAIFWLVLSIMAALGLAVLSIEEKKARKF